MNVAEAINFGENLEAEEFEAILRGYCRKIIQENLANGISSYDYSHSLNFRITPQKAGWSVNLCKGSHDETAKGDSLSHVNAEALRRLDFATSPKLSLSFEPMQ
jgi:hypothetical protein